MSTEIVNSPVIVVSLCLYFTQKISIPAHSQRNVFKATGSDGEGKKKDDANGTREKAGTIFSKARLSTVFVV